MSHNPLFVLRCPCRIKSVFSKVPLCLNPFFCRVIIAFLNICNWLFSKIAVHLSSHSCPMDNNEAFFYPLRICPFFAFVDSFDDSGSSPLWVDVRLVLSGSVTDVVDVCLTFVSSWVSCILIKCFDAPLSAFIVMVGVRFLDWAIGKVLVLVLVYGFFYLFYILYCY